MASRSIWQLPSPTHSLSWLVHDPFSGGGGPAFNPRSCVWVATQAFAGWGSRKVTVTAHNYIRWGQTGCVLQIANTFPTSFSVQGGRSLQNIIIMVAHAKFFGGNVGSPVKRDTDRLNDNLTTADPADNDFAAHVADLDFKIEPKELLDTKFMDFAVKPREESHVAARSESKDLYLARRQIRWVLRGCVRSRKGDKAPNAFVEECTCEEQNGAQEYYMVGGGWGSRPSTAEARGCQEAIHHVIYEGYTGPVFPGQCNCDGGFTNDDWQMLVSNPIGIPS
ncbi:hypothetical protein QL093DRAFT_2592731 [Fusarium oxysporum]|nr:hypothetical protein QL093DRAFT_2592731 [Fusarium oxysporum]